MLLWVISVGFENTCKVSGKWNVSSVIPRPYGWVYKILRLSFISGWTYCSGYDCRFPIKPIFDSRFMKFLFRISEGIKFWDLVENSGTDGPSPITVRMEYLFAFQFWYCELGVKSGWGVGRMYFFINFCSLVVL